MASLVTAPQALDAPRRRGVAVLTGGCDGYPAGTTGTISGGRDGCLVFAPDRPEAVARWAQPRRELLVPPALVVSQP